MLSDEHIKQIFCGHGWPGDCSFVASGRQIANEAYRAGLAAAMKAQCQGCRLGWKMTNGGHLMPRGGKYSQCQAERIRALIGNGEVNT